MYLLPFIFYEEARLQQHLPCQGSKQVWMPCGQLLSHASAPFLSRTVARTDMSCMRSLGHMAYYGVPRAPLQACGKRGLCMPA
jgi:hypothetical protein